MSPTPVVDRPAARETSRPVVLSLLAALLAVVVVLVVVHVVGYLTVWRAEVDGGPLTTSPWSLERDGGYGEIVGHAMQAAIASVLVLLFRGTRTTVHLAWASVFTLALLDDALQVHEKLGWYLTAELLGLPAELLGVRTQDLGELAVWGALGVVPLAAVLVLHRRAGVPAVGHSRRLGVLTAAYLFFGVVLDVAHSFAGTGDLAMAVGTVEDGGELVVLSFLVAAVAGFLRQQQRAPVPGALASSRT